MPERCRRLLILLQEGEDGALVCDVGALVHADLRAVGDLARVQLAARRLGREVRLRHASRELQELLALTGLADVLPLSAELET